MESQRAAEKPISTSTLHSVKNKELLSTTENASQLLMGISDTQKKKKKTFEKNGIQMSAKSGRKRRYIHAESEAQENSRFTGDIT